MGPVMVMAGGTGGHVFPALATARRLQEQGAEVFWLGSRLGMESRLVPEHGIEFESISVEGLRGNGVVRLLKAPFTLSLALFQAAKVILRRKPSAVLGMGGFASGPGGLMARLLGVPLVVHEQNKVPGLTNQWLARMAARVFEAFPGSFPPERHATACGNPVRREIIDLPPPAQRFAGREGPLRLLVLGGSQGAKALNDNLAPALADFPQSQRPQVRHQTGTRTLDDTRALYEQMGVEAEVVPFVDDMAEAYGWADLVFSRAGALTLSELAAAGVGALLVPYPHAVDDHQSKNAAYLVDVGAALLIPQAELGVDRLRECLRPHLDGRAEVLRMAEAARSAALTEADNIVAQACLEVAQS